MKTATDARLVLMVGQRHMLDDGSVRWEPGVQTQETLLTSFDALSPDAIQELHAQLDNAIARILQDRYRIERLEQEQ